VRAERHYGVSWGTGRLGSASGEGHEKRPARPGADDEWSKASYRKYTVSLPAPTSAKKLFRQNIRNLLKLVESPSERKTRQAPPAAATDPEKVYTAYKAAAETKQRAADGDSGKTLRDMDSGKAGEEGKENVAHKTNHELNEQGADRVSGLASAISRFSDEQNAKAPSLMFRPGRRARKMTLPSGSGGRALGGLVTQPGRINIPDTEVAAAGKCVTKCFLGGSERKGRCPHDGLRPVAAGASARQKRLASTARPIVARESRTLGMEGLFAGVGIYCRIVGQLYEPVDFAHAGEI